MILIVIQFIHRGFRGEYFLSDYITKIGNFDSSMIDTGFYIEGYVDNYNCDASELSSEGGSDVMTNRQWGRYKADGKIIYEFIVLATRRFVRSSALFIRT